MMRSLYQILTAIFMFSSIATAETYNFNPDWRFIREDVPGAEKAAFNDSAWKVVSAPHTYNDVDTFDDFHEEGHVGERNQWGGKTWYRKTLTVPAQWKDSRMIVEFEAVRQVAELFVNGKSVGKGESGFVPFGFDLTDHLVFGKENVLALQVNNEFIKDEKGKHKWDSYEGGARFPWNNPHWHPAHGGIYRNVKLHVLPPVHLTLPLFSNLETVGTYTYAVDASREQATIGVEPEIRNTSDGKVNLTVKSRIIGMDGNEVLALTQSVSLNPWETRIALLKGILKKPRLWEPKHPYVYRVVTELHVGDKLMDRGEAPLGVRWLTWNQFNGAYINDRYIKFQGWGHKPTDEWPGMGAAQPDWLRHFTLKFIPEAGGNFIRWGHCAGGPAQIRASDRLGIMTAQVGVDGEEDLVGYAWTVRANAFRDSIIYFRNNPSIVIWEGGNRKVIRKHVEELTGHIKRYDPHGGRGYGHRSPNDEVAEYSQVSVTMEGGGYTKGMTPIEGEYNRQESPRRVWDRNTPGFEKWHAQGSYDLTAEQYALNQVYEYEKIAPRSHGGGANWIYTDSTSGGRVTTETSRTSGELDGVRLPKEAYWVVKVIFTDEPDLHLLGHWNYPKGTKKNQYVVADCEEVELFLNGKSLGRQKSKRGIDTFNNYHPLIFSWRDLVWTPGTVEAVGYVGGKEVARMKKETHDPAVALKMTPITGPKGLMADGSDVALIDVEAVDAKGRRCLTWYGKVDFTCGGEGLWLGGFNSGKEKTIHKPYLNLECGINRVAVRSTFKPGQIGVSAKAEGLPVAKLVLESVSAGIENGMTKLMPPEPAGVVLQDLPLPDPNDRVMAKSTEPLSSEERIVKTSELISDLIYTGPSSKGADIVKPTMGQNWFTDISQKAKFIHPLIMESEQIRLPNKDWGFWAADVVGFTAKKDVWVYVAHNELVPDPGWLKKDYEKVEGAKYDLSKGRYVYQLYRKTVKAGDEVTIGGAVDDKSLAPTDNLHKNFLMYMVFVAEKKPTD